MSALIPPGYCPLCRESVRWGELTTGEFLPTSVDPDPDGTVTLSARQAQTPRATILTGDDLTAARDDGTQLFLRHEPACPRARPPEGSR